MEILTFIGLVLGSNGIIALLLLVQEVRSATLGVLRFLVCAVLGGGLGGLLVALYGKLTR